mmetsp:Transcript_20871/g.28964  ORF Transcript_20871/g.28964 Transcript_20871/m.28964 type:complete len:171 (+) Transcript_20871:431-943(+)
MVGLTEGTVLGASVGAAEGLRVKRVFDGAVVGAAEVATVGAEDGRTEGLKERVAEGMEDEPAMGEVEGGLEKDENGVKVVGLKEGLLVEVGFAEGNVDLDKVGEKVSFAEGTVVVGLKEGIFVTTLSEIGSMEGIIDLDKVGPEEGNKVGFAVGMMVGLQLGKVKGLKVE